MIMNYRNAKRCYSSSFCFFTYFSYLSKVMTNILHQKIFKFARSFGATFPIFSRNFCHIFRATFGFFERNFLGGLYNTIQ